MHKQQGKRPWRVYIGQVNQTFVDVMATDREDAEEKAERKWRREFAGARVLSAACIAAEQAARTQEQGSASPKARK